MEKKYGFKKLNRNNRLKTATSYGFNFSKDGMKLYLPWYDNKNTNNLKDDKFFIDQYNLLKPFDLSTLKNKPNSVKMIDNSLIKKNKLISNNSVFENIEFSNNLRNMYMVSDNGNVFFNFKLANINKIQSAQRINNTVIRPRESRIRDFTINEYGNKLYVVGNKVNTILEFNRNRFNGNIKLAHKETINFKGTSNEVILLNPRGSILFCVDGKTRKIFSYKMSQRFNLKSISKNPYASFSVPSNVTKYLEDIKFSTNGKKLFILNSYGGINKAGIYEYTLRRPFDLRTIIKNQTKPEVSNNTQITSNKVIRYNVVVKRGNNYWGMGNKYYINGKLTPNINFEVGNTYIFNQSHSSNSFHPLRFSTTPNGIHSSGRIYTNGVTVKGNAGNNGALVQIKITSSTPKKLYYYCVNHSGMGDN